MPEIIFDALVPTSHVPRLQARFEQLATAMNVSVTSEGVVQVDPEVERQLRAQVDGDSSEFYMQRFVIHAASNLNQTAMTFARLLTPHADLPPEPVALENEEAFEVAADYPWTVVIQP